MRRCTWPDEPQTHTAASQAAGVIDAQTGALVADWWGGNLLHDAPPIRAGGARMVVAWSGHPSADPAGFFERDPRAWLPAGAAALAAACDRLRAPLEDAGQTLVLRPHARHVLCDPTRCAAFLDRRRGEPFAVMLDVASMLEHGLESATSDFAARAVETLGPWPSVVMVRGTLLGAGALEALGAPGRVLIDG